MATKRVRKKVNLSSVAPGEGNRMLTLTESPANRIGFKVIRNDKDKIVVDKSEVKRSESTLMSITLPSGISEADAISVRSQFGFDDDYDVENHNGVYLLVHRDSKKDVPQTAIDIGNGMVGMVETSTFLRSEELEDSDDLKSVKLCTLVFSRSDFSKAADVEKWLTDNAIDYPKGAVSQGKEDITVKRSSVVGESFEVKLGEGVVGTVCLSKRTDVPVTVYRNVVEAGYGSYGFNHIDFTAALADPEFSDKSDNAIVTLRWVLDEVVFYSGLPLEERKQLIKNACDSFSDYMSSLIDALPSTVMQQARSDMNLTGQETTMSVDTDTKAKTAKADTQKVEAVRNDKSAKTKVEDKVETKSEAKVEESFIKRSELDDIVGNAVTSALEKFAAKQETEAVEEEVVERSDDEKDTSGDAIKSLVESVNALRSDLKDMQEGTTVQRSDSQDAVDEPEEAKSTSTFGGIFDVRR